VTKSRRFSGTFQELAQKPFQPSHISGAQEKLRGLKGRELLSSVSAVVRSFWRFTRFIKKNIQRRMKSLIKRSLRLDVGLGSCRIF
jgi:hypothetical protein